MTNTESGVDVSDYQVFLNIDASYTDFWANVAANGDGIRNVCRRFVQLCRELRLFTQAIVAIDSSKVKATGGELFMLFCTITEAVCHFESVVPSEYTPCCAEDEAGPVPISFQA